MKKVFIVVGVAILLALAGRGYWAYQQMKSTGAAATPTTPVVTPLTSLLASGMTRYNSGLFGITIDYDATNLFVHSFPNQEDGLYSIERLKGPLNFGNYVVGAPDAYKASEYYLTWSYSQYPGNLQQVLAQYCALDTKYHDAGPGITTKIEPQTLTTSDGTSIQGCHLTTTGGTISKPEIQVAEDVYFVEHPITKRIIEIHAVENFIGGGQETDVQKLYTQADGLVRSVGFYAPNQTGLDLLKKMDDTVNAFKVNPDQNATVVVNNGVGSFKENLLGIEVHFPSRTWYYKPSVLLSTEYKDQTPAGMKGDKQTDGADLLLSWRPLFVNDAGLKTYQNCTTDNTPGELHVLTAGGTKVYECISASEKSGSSAAWDVSFMLQNPITKYYIVFWGNVYGSSMSVRPEMLAKLENIVTATTFFQLSSDAAKQMEIMHDSLVGK